MNKIILIILAVLFATSFAIQIKNQMEAENQLDEDFDSCFNECVDSFATDASRLQRRRRSGRSALRARDHMYRVRGRSARKIQLTDDQEINDSYIAGFCDRECDSSEQ